jgi:hypothetical protein
LPTPVGVGRFVIRATHERGVGVPQVGAFRRHLVKRTQCTVAAYRWAWTKLTDSIPVSRTSYDAGQRQFLRHESDRVNYT